MYMYFFFLMSVITLTPTEARQKIFQFPALFEDTMQEIEIVFRGGKKMTVIDTEELERIKETLYVLQDPVIDFQLRNLEVVSKKPFSAG